MLKVNRLMAGSYEVPGTPYFFYRADLHGAVVAEDGISNRGLWYIYREGEWDDQFINCVGSYNACKRVVAGLVAQESTIKGELQ